MLDSIKIKNFFRDMFVDYAQHITKSTITSLLGLVAGYYTLGWKGVLIFLVISLLMIGGYFLYKQLKYLTDQVKMLTTIKEKVIMDENFVVNMIDEKQCNVTIKFHNTSIRPIYFKIFPKNTQILFDKKFTNEHTLPDKFDILILPFNAVSITFNGYSLIERKDNMSLKVTISAEYYDTEHELKYFKLFECEKTLVCPKLHMQTATSK